MFDQTRRDCLIKLGGLAAAAIGGSARAADPAYKYPRDLTKADVERWLKELSNWGRWGKDDQAGTINLITAAKRKQAAALVKDGVSVSMSVDADIPPQGVMADPPASAPPAPAAPGGAAPPRPRYTWEHVMRSNGAGRTDGFVMDSYFTSFHGSATTHLDALSHVIYDGKLFNGFPADSATTWGATKNDVMSFRNGIFTRGVLVDVPILKDVPYLADDEPVYPEDLEAWEKKAGIRIESGDAVFVRTGRWRRIAEKGPMGRQMPGLYVSSVKWFKERDIALFGSDGIQDVRPSRVDGVDQPVHLLFLNAVGTPLLDNCGLEDLSQAAAQRRRWTFLFTTAPLRVPGGTGSPINPIATF
jgi:kynurenine formamidase